MFKSPSNHLKGSLAEYIGLLYLLCKGYHPLAKNSTEFSHEIDLLLKKGDSLHIVEVKYRKTQEDAREAISNNQQRRLLKSGKGLSRKYPDKNISIDALYVFPHYPFVEYIENAW